MVARLAAQLQVEADSQMDEIRSQLHEKDREHLEAFSEQKNALVALNLSLIHI